MKTTLTTKLLFIGFFIFSIAYVIWSESIGTRIMFAFIGGMNVTILMMIFIKRSPSVYRKWYRKALEEIKDHPTKISLNEQNYRTLVSGGEVELEDTRGKIYIILQDIGFHKMRLIIYDAEIG